MKRKDRRIDRIGEERLNNQGCLMKIIEYNNSDNIIVEFQDNNKAKIHASYKGFRLGNIKNPYHNSVCGVGIVGIKYPCSFAKEKLKEYVLWQNLLYRCYSKIYKSKQPTYQDVTCCDEWLNYENFYEWLHNQENFDKWLNSNDFAIDKDIRVKGNKVYSPDACCLVPQYINNLFTKQDCRRDDLPIGVSKHHNKFRARINNVLSNKIEIIGTYETQEEAFYAYKKHKENLIKKIAKIEYDKSNIAKQCYDAMMKYEVEITD